MAHSSWGSSPLVSGGRFHKGRFVGRSCTFLTHGGHSAVKRTNRRFEGHPPHRPSVVVQKILDHVETGVTAVYDRDLYDNEKRAAIDAWGRQVDALLLDQPQRHGSWPFSVDQTPTPCASPRAERGLGLLTGGL